MKRIVIVVLILAIYIGGLLYKNQIQIANKGKTPPTISQIRKEKGIPVTSKVVEKASFEQKIRVSGFINKSGLLKAELTQDVVSKIQKTDNPVLEVNNKKYKGLLVSLSNRPNIFSGLYDVQIKFNDLPSKVFGKISVVSIPYKAVKDVVVLERSAVSFREKQAFAFVIDNESKLEKRKLKIKASNDDDLIVESGVKPGDLVVTSDQRYLNENDFVYNVSKEGK